MNEKLRTRERIKAEIKAIELECMDKEKEIRKLQYDIENLERDKKKLYRELARADNIAISQMPNGVKRPLNLIGIKTDDQLIKFVQGEFIISEDNKLLINTAMYRKADNPSTRIASIKGISKRTAPKMMELLIKYNSDQFKESIQ